MTDALEPLLGEVWEWKRQAVEETKGMSDAELIDFYKREAVEFQREYGLRLVSRPASEHRDVRRAR